MESRLSVLLCEDDEASARLIQIALERVGVHVTRAATGTKAWELLRAGGTTPVPTYDVVLLDWMLPGLEGPEILRLFREEQKRLGVEPTRGPRWVAVSARPRQDQDRVSFSPDAWIEKPFDLDALRSVVLQQAAQVQATYSGVLGSPGKDARDPALRAAYLAYREDLETFIQRLAAARARGDAEAIAGLAHTLAGSAPSYGFPELGELSACVEETLKTQGQGAQRVEPSSELLTQLVHLEALLRRAVLSYDDESVRAE